MIALNSSVDNSTLHILNVERAPAACTVHRNTVYTDIYKGPGLDGHQQVCTLNNMVIHMAMSTWVCTVVHIHMHGYMWVDGHTRLTRICGYFQETQMYAGVHSGCYMSVDGGTSGMRHRCTQEYTVGVT